MTKLLSFKSKKVIVFDLDGTIVNLTVDWNYLKGLLADRFAETYKSTVCLFGSISKCLDAIVEKEDESELINNFGIIREHELKEVKNSTMIPETVYFINNKDQFGVIEDVKLAVFSLNTRACIIEALKLAKVLDKFDFFIGREDVRQWKPEPEGLLKIQEHYQIPKEKIIYFGDLPKDLETGKKAGIEAYYIDEIIDAVRNLQQNG